MNWIDSPKSGTENGLYTILSRLLSLHKLWYKVFFVFFNGYKTKNLNSTVDSSFFLIFSYQTLNRECNTLFPCTRCNHFNLPTHQVKYIWSFINRLFWNITIFTSFFKFGICFNHIFLNHIQLLQLRSLYQQTIFGIHIFFIFKTVPASSKRELCKCFQGHSSVVFQLLRCYNLPLCLLVYTIFFALFAFSANTNTDPRILKQNYQLCKSLNLKKNWVSFSKKRKKRKELNFQHNLIAFHVCFKQEQFDKFQYCNKSKFIWIGNAS